MPPSPSTRCSAHEPSSARRISPSSRAQLFGPAEQADGRRRRSRSRATIGARQERTDVVLAEDRRLERARLRRGLEAELLVEPSSERAVRVERVVLAAERVEGEHLLPLRPLAEDVERDRRLRMCQRAAIVEVRERGVRRVDARAEHAALVGAAEILDPARVRLVLEQLAAREPERLLERAAREPRRLSGGAFQELVEAVEVELDQIRREAGTPRPR